MKTYVIGCGMGNPDTLTVKAARVIEAADVLIGAERLVAPYRDGVREVFALTRADDMVRTLREQADAHVGSAAVLMSGDVGFYSGATALCERLDDEGFDVEVIAGISSAAYFCAKLRTPWQDAFLVSAHGRVQNAVGEIQCHEKTFLLTGGTTKAHDICRDLTACGMGDVRVAVGERLSYDDERIVRGCATELADEQFADLSVMLVENDHPVGSGVAVPCLADCAFERADVPMTKEDVRHLAVCKLGVTRDAVVWDIGAGTGSVSCELALAACAGFVYAVERNEEAAHLAERNAARLGVRNVTVVRGEAPDACADLPMPTHLFVGGSAGRLGDVLALALKRNPAVRVVVSAVTLETLSAMLECTRDLPLSDVDIAQVQVSCAREAGRYHLMSAHNPVYLISAQGVCDDD